MYNYKIIYQITDITFSLFVCFQNSDVTRREDCMEASEEEEVSGREEFMARVPYGTPGMDSSLPTSPTAAVGEGVFTGDDGATEETLEEVSSREEIIPGVSNETPGMDSSLPTSPTVDVGKGFFSCTPESMEEEELETQDDLAMDTATDVDVQNLQKIGWDDVALTKCKTICLLVSYNL